MSIVILNHKVRDFNTWKPYYDADASRRAAAGLKELHLATNEADPNEVFVILETQDAGNAKKMMEDPKLHELMEKAGVISAPKITVLKEI